MTSPQPGSRRAGILVPLFSIPSTRSWGIGEIGDIEPLARWLGWSRPARAAAAADQRDAAGRTVALFRVERDGDRSAVHLRGSARRLRGDRRRAALSAADSHSARGGAGRAGDRLRHGARASRSRRCGTRSRIFATRKWRRHAPRICLPGVLHRAVLVAGRLRPVPRAACALRRARRGPNGRRSCAIATRPRSTPRATELADDILFRQYLQWVAGDQWGSPGARRAVALFGDLPFMVSGDSADVWARQDEFRLDASVGVPPDAFSDTGQDWGLPAYRWDVLAARDFDWLRHRARRNADLYDGYRVDHLVGFYRTYFRPQRWRRRGSPRQTNRRSRSLGERVLDVFLRVGRRNHRRGSRHRSRLRPRVAGAGSACRATRCFAGSGTGTSRGSRSGTRSSTRLSPWRRPGRTTPSRWRSGGSRHRARRRQAVLAIPSVRERLDRRGSRSLRRTVRICRTACARRCSKSLYASGADLLILPIQDVFGWRDRINQPATVGDGNWTWRLPWPVDRLLTEPEAMAVARSAAGVVGAARP